MSTNATAAAAAFEAAAQAALSVDKGLSFGPFIVGGVVDAVLLGIMVVQFANWISYTSKERIFIRAIVCWCFGLSVIISIFTIAYLMHLFAYGFGVYTPFEETDWLGWYPFLDVCVTFPVQTFYAERAWRLNNNSYFLVITILVLMLGGFAGGLGTKIAFSLLTSASQASHIQVFVYLWLSCTMAADVIITLFIMLGLFRSRTGWSHTDALIKRLLMISAESQLAPTLIAIGFLIEYRIQADSFIGAFFELIQSKVYIVGLLAVLNSRFSLRRDMESDPSNVHVKSNTFSLGNRQKFAAPTVLVTEERFVETSPPHQRPNGLNRMGSEYDKFPEDEGEQFDYDNSSKTGLTAAEAISSLRFD